MRGKRTHYRVVWKREGLKQKSKRYVHIKGAHRMMNVLTSPEPWKFFANPMEADDYVCCSGHECGCGGETAREQSEAKSKDLPKLEWVRLEQREVTPWESVNAVDRKAESSNG